MTWQTCVGISRCLSEQVHRKGFIAMKGSVVGADDLIGEREKGKKKMVKLVAVE